MNKSYLSKILAFITSPLVPKMNKAIFPLIIWYVLFLLIFFFFPLYIFPLFKIFIFLWRQIRKSQLFLLRESSSISLTVTKDNEGISDLVVNERLRPFLSSIASKLLIILLMAVF